MNLFPKRIISDAVGRLRRAIATTDWFEGEGLSMVTTAPIGRCDPEAWRQWLTRNVDVLPPDCRPEEGGENVQSMLLAAVTGGPPTSRVGGSSDAAVEADVYLMPLYDLQWAGAIRKAPSMSRVRWKSQDPVGRDDLLLWSTAWWAARILRLCGPAYVLNQAWRAGGHRLVDRLTIEEVWRTRRSLIELFGTD